MTRATPPAGLEDTVRREALKCYMHGDEEQALDLLTVARAIAEPARRSTAQPSGGR
jgi:hypothetical protein